MSDTDSTGPDESARPTRRAVLRRSGWLAVGTVATTAGCVGGGRDEEADGASGGEEADGEPGPSLVAHRGCAAENPENTVAAIEASAAVADRIELDVRRCGTGELVVFHDETLDRVTDASGRVDRTSRARLAALDVEGSGEPVPTLAEALDAVPSDVSALLDLKERGTAADALAVGAGRDSDLAVTADDPAVIGAVDDAAPSVPTVYAVRESVPARPLRPLVPEGCDGPALPEWAYPPQDVAGTVETATDLGCAALSPRYELCLRTDLVARAGEAGLRVLPWTVASAREYAAVAATGADAVVSDVCDGIRK